MAKRVPSDIFFNTIGLGLAVYLGVTVLFTSPLLAVGMFIASVIFAIDIYENVFGKPSVGRGSALAVAIFEIIVLGFFLPYVVPDLPVGALKHLDYRLCHYSP